MNEDEFMNTLWRALAHWGELQELKTGEECCELSQAILKRHGALVAARTSGDKMEEEHAAELLDHVYEEMGDVEIMLAQMYELHADARKRVDVWKQFKMDRLKKKLDKLDGITD